MIRVFSFLQRNPNSGILYFRYVVPERYRSAFGRSEIKFSLRTTDKHVAFPLAMQYHAEVQEKIRCAEGATMIKRKNSVPDNSFSKITASDLDIVTGKVGNLEIDFGGDIKKELAAMKEVKAILQPTVQLQQSLPSPVVGSLESVKLSVFCAEFVDTKLIEKAWTPKTANSHIALHELLIQILGNIQSATITRSNGRLIKDIITHLPPNLDKDPRYRGKTVKQILTMKPEPQNIKTAIDKITKLSSLFQWGVLNEKCPLNPFEGLKPRDGRKPSEQRSRFSDDDLKKIFDPVRFNRKDLDEFQFFMPLLALHSGARVNELAALRTIDIFDEGGITLLNLTEQAAPKKTASSVRKIPLHPYLAKVGFMDYVKTMKAKGSERLFPRACKNKTGPGDKASDWFNRSFLPKTGIDRTKKSFHSFRHTFADGLKQLDVNPLRIRALTGHSDGSMETGRYGKDFSMQGLYDVVCLLDFDI